MLCTRQGCKWGLFLLAKAFFMVGLSPLQCTKMLFLMVEMARRSPAAARESPGRAISSGARGNGRDGHGLTYPSVYSLRYTRVSGQRWGLIFRRRLPSAPCSPREDRGGGGGQQQAQLTCVGKRRSSPGALLPWRRRTPRQTDVGGSRCCPL